MDREMPEQYPGQNKVKQEIKERARVKIQRLVDRGGKVSTFEVAGLGEYDGLYTHIKHIGEAVYTPADPVFLEDEDTRRYLKHMIQAGVMVLYNPAPTLLGGAHIPEEVQEKLLENYEGSKEARAVLVVTEQTDIYTLSHEEQHIIDHEDGVQETIKQRLNEGGGVHEDEEWVIIQFIKEQRAHAYELERLEWYREKGKQLQTMPGHTYTRAVEFNTFYEERKRGIIEVLDTLYTTKLRRILDTLKLRDELAYQRVKDVLQEFEHESKTLDVQVAVLCPEHFA